MSNMKTAPQGPTRDKDPQGRFETVFAIFDSPLDRMLIAASRQGIRALFMASADAPLRTALEASFPAARETDDLCALWAGAVIRHLGAGAPAVSIPVDAVGSLFQRRVWTALRDIPYGEVRTYGEIARRLGRPGAYRAIARACATNPVSVVVPCHRVIRADGNLAGYRWGLRRKRILLENERRRAQDEGGFFLRAS